MIGWWKPRFWVKVGPILKEGCWTWTGTHSVDGYGTLEIGNRNFRAHRLSWFIHYGKIPEGMCVLHRCDNPGCVNPEHLFLGTQNDNIQDCKAKGRRALGERHGRAKLTGGQVAEIRERYSYRGRDNMVSLAKEFGVSSHTVSMIVKNRIWKRAQ